MAIDVDSGAKDPVFLIGAERSGTTLLRLMLTHHPLISWRNEFEYAVDKVTDDGVFPALESYYEWLGVHRIFEGTKATIDRELTYPELVRSFLEQKRAADDKPLIGATIHRHFARIGHIWPSARYIYLLRDGRDVARSAIGMGWAGNVWTGATRWMDAEEEWGTLKTLLSEDRWMEVRYEDLVAEPERYLRQMCTFIGVAFDAKMLSYSDNSSYGPPDAGVASKWKTKWPEKEIRLCESRIGGMLEARGYALSGLAPLELTEADVKRLWREDRVSLFKHRIRQLGLGLVLSEMLARRLGMRGLERKLQLQINAKARARIR